MGGSRTYSHMKSPTPNPYEVLGVPKTATEEDIKSAYKQKVKEHHPDVGGDEEACKQLNVAYETLIDKDRRSEYDAGGVKMGSGDPMEAFFRHFGGVGGFRFTGGQGGAFSFHSQQVIQCMGEMTLGQMLFGDKEFEVSSPVGKVKFPLPPRTSPGQSFNIRVHQDSNGETVIRARVVLRMPTRELTEEEKKVIREIQ